MEDQKIIEVNNYDGIKVDEYNGKISLVAMQKGQNEVWYLKWAFLSRWKKGETEPVPDTKKMPMKVLLGNDKEQAQKIIKEIWELIK